MNHIDLQKLKSIALKLFIPVVQREYGDTGVAVLREVMEFLRELYVFLPPESISESLVVLKSLDNQNVAEKTPIAYSVYSSAEFLAQDYVTNFSAGNATIEICKNGDILIWSYVETDHLSALSGEAIVYVYQNRFEKIVVKGNDLPIDNPSQSHASIFAIPTFRVLEDALEEYKHKMVRTSQCKILSMAWYNGPQSDRLFFNASPEFILRDSLWQYLSSVLGAEVRPEQVVDESHPCDIKVTWMQTNRIALIEIKWLGKSLNREGRITQDFYDGRAREGAQQLANYLDANRRQAPTHNARGYLVIVDARRRGLNPERASINNVDGLYYSNREISFEPPFHLHRKDFYPPIRMFAEPICRPD